MPKNNSNKKIGINAIVAAAILAAGSAADLYSTSAMTPQPPAATASQEDNSAEEITMKFLSPSRVLLHLEALTAR
jgi:hypothetical protein